MLDDVTDFCRLILLRYPELEGTHHETAVGSASVPLSRRGRAMVARWMQDLAPIEIDRVYAAAAQAQCVEPGRAIAEPRSVPLVEDGRLQDQNLGEWQGRSWAEVAQADPDRMQTFFQDFGEAQAPGGESLGQAVERMLDWWGSIAKEGLGKTFVVVTSGSMITGFAAAMLGMRLSRCVSLNLPHGAVGILECFANGVRVATWNPNALSPDQ